MSGGGPSAGTNGFLFCDLRGYTAFVEAHGDQAAAGLLATYRELVRTAIAAHAGAEIKTEGDSVYVVFPAASAAVEAGLEIVAGAAAASTRERPIRVGVGIHAGETVATTEGLVGGAVNIAARVCAKAQAGEVLVTDTVRALTRTYLPYRYTSLGTQTLKGIAGGIPLYRVEAVPSSARARLARQVGARRGRVTVLAGLVVVALVAATGVYALNRPTDCLSLPTSTKDVVARIDPARNCVVAVYPVGQRPSSVVVSDGILWVANLDDQTVTWLDPTAGTSSTTAAGGPPIELTTAPGSVAVLDHSARLGSLGELLQRDQVARIMNVQKRMIQAPAPLPDPRGSKRDTASNIGISGYQALAVVADQVWVTNAQTGQVIRMPLNGGGASAVQIESPDDSGPNDLGAGIGPIAAGQGTVWIANADQPVLYRMVGPSDRPDRMTLDGSGGSTAIDVTDEAVWLARNDGRVTRFKTGDRSIASFAVGGTNVDLAAGPSSIWVADSLGRTVRAVDPKTGAVRSTVNVGGRPAGVAIAPDGSVWVTIQAP